MDQFGVPLNATVDDAVKMVGDQIENMYTVDDCTGPVVKRCFFPEGAWGQQECEGNAANVAYKTASDFKQLQTFWHLSLPNMTSGECEALSSSDAQYR